VTADVSRQTYPFSLPDLPYAYDALEPHIDEMTLRIHHREHHATYVKKLNEALADDPQLRRLSLAQLLRDVAKLPEAVRTSVRNNGGGHLNHDLFWR
jgi:Fe-Mn family superoxide dismutase